MASRILGIDYGMKRIGLSLSDETHLIATPLETFQASHKLEHTVSDLARFLKTHQQKLHYALKEVIVGFPLRMSGSISFISDEVSLFVDMLAKSLDVPVIKWDERLTSVQAERALREGSFSRKKRAKKLDQISAVIILQNYLDSKNFTT